MNDTTLQKTTLENNAFMPAYNNCATLSCMTSGERSLLNICCETFTGTFPRVLLYAHAGSRLDCTNLHWRIKQAAPQGRSWRPLISQAPLYRPTFSDPERMITTHECGGTNSFEGEGSKSQTVVWLEPCHAEDALPVSCGVLAPEVHSASNLSY